MVPDSKKFVKKFMVVVILGCFILTVILSLIESMRDLKKINTYMQVRVQEIREDVEKKCPNMTEEEREKEVQNRADDIRDLYEFHLSQRFMKHFGVYGIGIVIIVAFLLGMRVRVSPRRW